VRARCQIWVFARTPYIADYVSLVGLDMHTTLGFLISLLICTSAAWDDYKPHTLAAVAEQPHPPIVDRPISYRAQWVALTPAPFGFRISLRRTNVREPVSAEPVAHSIRVVGLSSEG